MTYKTINEFCINELIIKKSRFICILAPLKKVQDVQTALSDIKQDYPGANHYCFAYRTNQNNNIIERCSDDGEPSGTAGWPILSVIKQKELTNIMAVVIRYFGGTLLGTGGLIRAYTQSVQAALDKSIIVTMGYAQKIAVTIDYNFYGIFEKQFSSLINKETGITYTDRVKLELWVTSDKTTDFITEVENLTQGTATIKFMEAGFVQQ